MSTNQQLEKQVKAKNEARDEWREFVDRAAIAALQGMLTNQNSWGMEPAKAAEIAHNFARALADSVKPIK